MKKRRASPGDVLTFISGGKRAFLQYLGRHPEYGDAVAVCPGFRPLKSRATVKDIEDSYVTFYPVQAAIRAGLVEIVYRLPAAGMPSRIRRPGIRSSKDGTFSWFIKTGDSECRVRELTKEDRKLPIAEIVNHEYLIERIRAKWRPETDTEWEVEETHADEREERGGAEHLTVHYLYFPDEVSARLASRQVPMELKVALLATGLDGEWLVEVRQLAAGPSDVDRVASQLELIAKRTGGEYDGREARFA
jgi:hypothetical protein